jgi:hypothetical protein
MDARAEPGESAEHRCWTPPSAKESAVRHCFCLGLAVLIAAANQPCRAQAPNPSPRVTIAHKGADKLLKDLEALLKLTNPKQQKQWKVIKDNVIYFLPGVDRTKPVRLDLVPFGAGKISWQPSIPVTNINVFRTRNLKPAGINTIRQAASRYKCKGNVFQGFMRYKWGYAIFAEKLNAIPLNIANPRNAIKGLLESYDLGLEGENKATDPAAIAARRAWVKAQAKELLAALKKKEGESTADFELRKLLLQQQMKEAERFYSESAKLRMGWTMDFAKMTGRADLELAAIPNTPLARSIRMLGTRSSYFANVPRNSDSILSLRINHPLDDMRKEHFLAAFKAVRDSAVQRLKDNKTMNDSQRTAGTKIADMVVQLLAANADKGIFDAFAEVRMNKAGKKTSVAALRTVDGLSVVDILKQFPDTGKVANLKMDIDKEGDVRIHRIVVNLSPDSPFRFFMGGDDVLVGTSKDAVWFACGNDALSELKAAVKLTRAKVEPKPAPFVDLFVRLRPWIELRDKAAGKKGKPELRALAIDALTSGQDGISAQLVRKGDRVMGRMHVETGVLRLVGAMAAKFSRDTLDGNNKNKKPSLKLNLRSTK